MSLPARSSRMKVKPPEEPMPGIAGGVIENEMPSGSALSRRVSWADKAEATSDLDLRSSQGFNLTKKKPE